MKKLPSLEESLQLILEECRVRYGRGDQVELFAAIRICATFNIVMPPWLSQAFISGHNKILNFEAKSWDAAFGAPFPKGTHLKALKKKREKTLPVWREVNTAIEIGVPVDLALFDKIGNKLGISRTLVSEYYYAIKSKFSISGEEMDSLLDQLGIPEKKQK